MSILEHDVLFQYNGIATQPVGVPGLMGITLAMPGTVRWELSYIRIGNDNYGSARLIDAYIVNSSGVVIIKIGAVTIDNLRHIFPSLKTLTDDDTEDDSTLGVPPKLLLGSTQGISLRAASLANAETLTVELVLRMRGLVAGFPSIVALGAGVTLSAETKRFI